MATSKNPVAYVPTSKTTEAVITAPTKIDIPEYPDVGVSFAGYSKKLSSGNSYRLSVQEPYECQTVFTWTAASTLLTLAINSKQGKTIFIKNITVTMYTDTACSIAIANYQGAGDFNNLAVLCCGAGQSNNMSIEYPAPIKIDKISWAAQPNTAITGRVSIVITGWYEDNL